MNLTDVARRYKDGLETIIEWLGSGGICVDIPIAQERTSICLKCPHNVKGGIIPESVASAIKRQVELKNEIGLRTHGMKDLHTCELCTCFLPLKIFVPLENLGIDEKEALESWPHFCWIYTEHKQKKEQNEQIRNTHQSES